MLNDTRFGMASDKAIRMYCGGMGAAVSTEVTLNKEVSALVPMTMASPAMLKAGHPFSLTYSALKARFATNNTMNNGDEYYAPREPVQGLLNR